MDERERVQRPDIVKRLSLARRGGSPPRRRPSPWWVQRSDR